MTAVVGDWFCFSGVKFCVTQMFFTRSLIKKFRDLEELKIVVNIIMLNCLL